MSRPKWEYLVKMEDALTPKCSTCGVKLGSGHEDAACFLTDGLFVYFCAQHIPEHWNGTRLTFE